MTTSKMIDIGTLIKENQSTEPLEFNVSEGLLLAIARYLRVLKNQMTFLLAVVTLQIIIVIVLLLNSL